MIDEIIDDMTEEEVDAKKVELSKQLTEAASHGIEPAKEEAKRGRKPSTKTFINISGGKMYGVKDGESFTLEGYQAAEDGIKNAVAYKQIKEA